MAKRKRKETLWDTDGDLILGSLFGLIILATFAVGYAFL